MRTRSALRRRGGLTLALVLTSCGGSDSGGNPAGPDTEQVSSVTVSSTETTVASDATIQLDVTIKGSNGSTLTGQQVSWASSDESVATVSSGGLVTTKAVLAGAAASVRITASSGGRSGSLTLQVTPVPAASVELSMGDFAIATGDSRPLTIDVKDASGRGLSGRSGSWSSSNEAVLTVSDQGVVLAQAGGASQLTVTIEGISASVAVTSVDTDTYLLPVDLTTATYPWDYRIPKLPSSSVSTDPCSLDNSALEVPRSSMGRNALPAPNGAPLAPGIARGVGHKDVFEVGNPAFAEGCAGDARAQMVRTLDRLAALGADYVSFVPWTFIAINSGIWSIMDPDDVQSSILGDADLGWVVQQAHARGLEVHWINQIQGALVEGVGTNPEPTRENVATFLEVLEPYMLERAAFLQASGVDVMHLSCTCWVWLNGTTYEDLYIPSIEALLPKVKQVFSGKIRMNAAPGMLNSSIIKSGVDYMQMSFLFGANGLPADGLTVETLKSGYRSALQGQANTFAALGVPVILEIDAASRSRVFTTGYIEETFCTAGFGSVWPSDADCIQRLAEPDFSIQAMAYQAALEVIHEQTLLDVYGVETSGYWMVDQLTPSTTFPNIAVSARNKPAEGLLKLWFAR